MFKQRPLPRSKKEAIDLMMQQPNLIKRPILVRGTKVTFGFKKDEYEADDRAACRRAAHEIRVGTSGWSYPSGQRHVERDLLSRSAGAAAPRHAEVRRARVLRRALRHRRSELVVLPGADGGGGREVGGADAGRIRVLAEAVSEVHAPRHVREGDRRRPVTAGHRRTSTSSGPRSSRWLDAGKLGALLAQFPASFKNDPESRGYLEWLLKAFRDYPVAVELRHRSWSDDSRPRRRTC